MSDTSYSVAGRVHWIGPEESNPSGSYKKRRIVLDTGGKYPQKVELELGGKSLDKVDLHSVGVGDDVVAHFNLRGREWTKQATGEVKYFNTLALWKIETTSAARPASGGGGHAQQSSPGWPDDDIPF